MRQVFRIDKIGSYIEPVILEDNASTPTDCIEIKPPEGLHDLNWNGTQWVEGKTDVELLQLYKSQKLTDLQNQRDIAIYSTFQSSALGTPKTYAYDSVAKERLSGQLTILLANSNITSVNWVNAEDGLVAHTRAQFIQVVNDAYNHESTQDYKYIKAEPQINAATDISGVDAIVAGIVW